MLGGTYVSRDRDVEGLLELSGGAMVLAEKARADASVVDGYELVIVIGLLRVLPVVHVTQIVLLALEEDDCQAI